MTSEATRSGSPAGPTSGRMTTPRIEKIALRLPDWMGSIRFRLTALYSIVLFGLAAMVVAGIYLALAERLDDATIYARVPATRVQTLPDGQLTQRFKLAREAAEKLGHADRFAKRCLPCVPSPLSLLLASPSPLRPPPNL